MYKEINGSRISKFMSDLLNHAKSNFPIEQHSDDSTGGMGEDVPPYVQLCREFEEWKKASPSANTQQQSSRIVSVVVQQSLLEPRYPLGPTGATLRSQIGAENPVSDNARPTAASTLTGNASLVGIVEEAGVASKTRLSQE